MLWRHVRLYSAVMNRLHLSGLQPRCADKRRPESRSCVLEEAVWCYISRGWWQGVGVCSLMLTRVPQSSVRAHAPGFFFFNFYYLFVGLMQIIIILN